MPGSSTASGAKAGKISGVKVAGLSLGVTAVVTAVGAGFYRLVANRRQQGTADNRVAAVAQVSRGSPAVAQPGRTTICRNPQAHVSTDVVSQLATKQLRASLFKDIYVRQGTTSRVLRANT
jgi:hypothetical protein